MVFDSEPQPGSDELSVELPPKNSPFGAKAADGAATPSPQPDTSKAPAPAPARAPAPDSSSASPAPAPAAPPVANESPPSRVETAVAPAARLDARAPSGAAPGAKGAPAKSASPSAGGSAVSSAAPSAEQQRALALLEGRNPAPAPIPTVRKGAPGAVAVQIAALSSPEKVQELVERLSGSGVKSYTEKVETPQGTRTRVRLGPYASRDEAQKALERVKGLGLDGSLVTP